MGDVFKARDTRLDRTVAIKILHTESEADRSARDRLAREARAISALTHPHICTLYDIGAHEGIDFLVMEYVEGETLAQRLVRGALPVEQALLYAVQITSALDRAHSSGIVHRDIKPANVMITRAGAKLLDFGLARPVAPVAGAGGGEALSATDLTQSGLIVGTVQYMAPEQLEGRAVDARTDIFSFGALLYEMVSGRRAFTGDSAASVIASILEHEPPRLTTLQPHVPSQLERVASICLKKNPDDRWQSARDLPPRQRHISGAALRSPARPWARC
jgi:serine/threonine protein kinase